jgi:demethylmenaquinone methyltransferase / 2-methoxy-6-polyprenyl-1,4-benzoquinol methylase
VSRDTALKTPLPPHPTLSQYYQNDADRAAMVRDLFDQGAGDYEWICRVMSLGTGGHYRKQALLSAGFTPGMRLLDVATGTGPVLRAAVDASGGKGLVVGLDPSRGMLNECRKNCAAPLHQGRGEKLPFIDGSFDMVSMGYALRHVPDLRELFLEYRRVLKPGGRVVILEITQPRSSAGRWLNRIYLRNLVPGLARFGSQGPAASRMMEYFWDTIEACVPPESILEALSDAGLVKTHRATTGGIFSAYTAQKP